MGRRLAGLDKRPALAPLVVSPDPNNHVYLDLDGEKRALAGSTSGTAPLTPIAGSTEHNTLSAAEDALQRTIYKNKLDSDLLPWRSDPVMLLLQMPRTPFMSLPSELPPKHFKHARIRWQHVSHGASEFLPPSHENSRSF